MHCFDTQAWANEIYTRNLMAFGVVDKVEVHLRAHIATTYRTTACLYMLLIAPGLQSYMRRRAQSRAAGDDHVPTLLNTEDYAATTLKLLSFVPAASPLFKYTTWPVFMTGVETALPERRAWVMERMQAMLDLCPWGMLTAAMETLTEIWRLRDAATAASEGGDCVVSGDPPDTGQSPKMNWLLNRVVHKCTHGALQYDSVYPEGRTEARQPQSRFYDPLNLKHLAEGVHRSSRPLAVISQRNPNYFFLLFKETRTLDEFAVSRSSSICKLVASTSIASRLAMAHVSQPDKCLSEVGAGDGAAIGRDVEQPTHTDYDVDRVERVYRKLDLRIIPAFWVLYFLCSAIRSNIGLAQTMNADVGHDLMTVLGLTPRDVSTTLTLFYVSYVIFDCPSNLIMSKLSPRVWMSRIVFAVGVIGVCFTAVRDAWSVKLLRFLLGVVIAGMWPGMAYYLTLFYPPSRTGKRIGYYFTASQVSASVVGLVSAGFQLMDGAGGLVGFQWMFLIYGLCGVVLGVVLLWWLPDRPLPPGEKRRPSRFLKWVPSSPEALSGEDALVHYEDLKRVYHPRPWTLKDLGYVLVDWRLWPLTMMYFGVVGVGIGTQMYGTVIIRAINPRFTGVQLSLLFAPIWIMDLIAILLVTPIADRFHRLRPVFFSCATCIQIAGLLTTTFAPVSNPWARYGGLLMVGFGLGPTVPTCMTWTNEIFQRRHGEVGVAAASALVSGLGNLGSVTTTYALYTGWPADAAPGPHQFRKSNLIMIAILCVSILSSALMFVLLKLFGNEPSRKIIGSGGSSLVDPYDFQDGAARREVHQRGFGRRWRNKSS
ncbi:hypothetical protein DL771_004141 [Monosporascus sp. 5C6A]|nr:hypothetical protein DL771_004141 [Monosporascus sp. 5C6A]